MKSKILSLFLLTAILSLAMVSATNNFSFDSSTSQSQTISDFINITSQPIFTSDNSNINPIINFTSTTVTVDISSISTKSLNLGDTYIGTILINDNGTQVNRTFEMKPTYCTYGCTNNKYLKISDVNIKNKGMGENDNEWYAFDDIEVDITVDNIYNGGDPVTNDDLRRVTLEWCLYDETRGRCTDIEDTENDFTLKEGKDKKITINFNVNPNDLRDTSSDYTFYVKAYSDHSSFGYEKNSCVEYSEPIYLQRDNFMLLNNVVFPDIVPCKGTLDITGEVWNIYDDREDDVSMRIYNKDLGINDIVRLGDIDSLDKKDFSVEYKIPKDLTEKLYTLEFRIMDQDGDTYEADTNDKSVYLYQFKVAGNCQVEISEPQITAELDSETPSAVAGKQVIIKSTIKNTAEVETTYSISIFGNSAWSNQKSIDPQLITLEPGQSKDINIILDIDADAQGDKELTIRADYNEQTTEQKVALSIEKSAGQDAVITHLKNNWFIYLIVIINIILIIAIIAVVKSMVGKNPAVI